MKKRIFTPETWASVREMVEQGKTPDEIAKHLGTTRNSLGAMACKHGISLRRGGRRQPKPSPYAASMTLVMDMKLFVSLERVAAATGRNNPATLARDLLDRIANDGLYRAVLDEEMV